jgi:hypothetical protein
MIITRVLYSLLDSALTRQVPEMLLPDPLVEHDPSPCHPQVLYLQPGLRLQEALQEADSVAGTALQSSSPTPLHELRHPVGV